MAQSRHWDFGPFRLNLEAELLWRGEDPVRLTAKAFGVLRHLVEHPERLVSKEELFAAVWSAPFVSDAALAVCIRELRQALGDVARMPQYVETVRGRGYRFIAPVTSNTALAALDAPSPVLLASSSLATPLVGRETELAALQRHWARAQQGFRQVVLITGEVGIGKTALVDTFVTQVAGTHTLWYGRGQCIEQHGGGEPYLPLLEALGRLGQGADGERLRAVLWQHAPSWLVHLPTLASEQDHAGLQRRAAGATRERMLRELAEAVEVLTAVRPLVLVVEDLHWCDVSTLDWLAYVAHRREAARLLLVGTYRPVEAIARANPVHTVTQTLRLHGRATEVLLNPVSVAGVAAYLAWRFGNTALPATLAEVLHQRTDGHPLFLVTVVDDLVRQGLLRHGEAGWELRGGVEGTVRGVPNNLQQLIEQQFAQLAPADQTLLEAASVAGTEFVAAAVAAGLDEPVEAVEERCAALASRGQFVRTLGVADWPDGTHTTHHGFRHALYREVLYERVSISQRGRWHRQIGARLEAGFGEQARLVAVELAEHFVRGRDTERAVRYLQYAGEQAVQRSAHQEALQHFTQALAFLATLPESAARAQQELDMQLALGAVYVATKGLAAVEVEQTYSRARVLCQQVGATSQIVPALRGLCEFYRNRGVLPVARELGTQLDQLTQRAATPTLHLEAHEVLANTLFFLGEFSTALMHLEQVLARTDLVTERSLALRHGVALGVRCLGLAANTLWFLGYPAQAVQRQQKALTLAQELAHPYSLAVAHYWATYLAHHRREVPAVQAQAAALLNLATSQGFPLFIGHGACWHGWALVMQGQEAVGLPQMRQGMTAALATGQTLMQPLSLLLLAEVAQHTAQREAGLRLLREALTVLQDNGQGDLLAEVYRLQGALLLAQQAPGSRVQGSTVQEAEACFQHALTLARRQQAKSWELRAAMSLSRLWLQHGKRAAAYALLAEVYGWFTEGFDTADLQEAGRLLAKLA